VRWLDEPGGLFLLIPRAGDRIVAFDLGAGQIREVDWLARHEDEGSDLRQCVNRRPSGLRFP
jgi:hypothetical protein